MGTTDGSPIGEGEERGNKSGVIHPPSEMAACDWSDLSLCLLSSPLRHLGMIKRTRHKGFFFLDKHLSTPEATITPGAPARLTGHLKQRRSLCIHCESGGFGKPPSSDSSRIQDITHPHPVNYTGLFHLKACNLLRAASDQTYWLSGKCADWLTTSRWRAKGEETVRRVSTDDC